MTIASSLYAFPSDLADEGVPEFVAAVRSLGLSKVSLALAYHQARDVVPHAAPHGGAKPRIRYRRDGVFFEPSPVVWDAVRLRPRLQPERERRAAAALIEGGELEVEAWTVFLHNTDLGEEHPEAASLTCFGDRILSNLCPSNPEVRDYAVALARDVSARGVDVVAEALSAQTFAHGHHHERSFAPLSAGDEALLAVCFCAHCTSGAAAAGCDVERLAARVRERVQAAWGGAPGVPADLSALATELGATGEDLLALMAARERAVESLAASVAAAVHGNGRALSFMDLTGAVLGYDTGHPSGPPAAEQAWRLGIRPAAVGASGDSYSVLGYAADPERLESDVASYVAALGGTPLRVILRPGFPDTSAAEHLARKVSACRAAGAAAVDFYNYGMYDAAVLARVPGALFP